MRLLWTSILGLSISIAAFATEPIEAIAKLNSAIDQVLSEFRDENTQANLVFDRLEVDDVRAVAFKMHANYKKVGPANFLEMILGNLEYLYNETSPRVEFNGSIGLDLTKWLTQAQLNQMIPDIENTIIDIAKGFTSDYGDAARVSVTLTEKNQDKDGNFISVRGAILVEMDISKLPESEPSSDMPFTKIDANIFVDLKSGAELKLAVNMNPEFRAFQRDQKGMKDFIEDLLNNNSMAVEGVRRMFMDLEGFAFDVVNKTGH